MLGPFQKQDSINPILSPLTTTTFACPVQGTDVRWEGKYVFNPAAVVKDGKVYLLYRAEDGFWGDRSTSRIGLAWSNDGIRFQRRTGPVLFPDSGAMSLYEWPGGCEDPRIVEDGIGGYVLTYTAWDRQTARLCVATSFDLLRWTKHGPAFKDAYAGRYKDFWSKSGAIVCDVKEGKFVARRVNGRYWMYWGDTDIFLAWSKDLIRWTPVERIEVTEGRSAKEPVKRRLLPVVSVRKGEFDSQLVEPGPPAFVTSRGILLIYNSCAAENSSLPQGTYATGQILFDSGNPAQMIERTREPFLKPDREYEISGQVSRVCFVEGLVQFKGRFFLYYGSADSRIAVAVWSPE